MGFPAIEPGEVGLTGLAWLFLSYGYVLYYASNLIGEGSELLLLVPSMAGLVGGVVLPLLGAVPDGAIILFSGLGSIEEAQETLSVGVGALAGSTIMLLTVPLSISIFSGRVDIDDNGIACYSGRPKLTPKSFAKNLRGSGVAISDAVREGGKIMIYTTVPYFLIQGSAFFIHGPSEEVAKGEKWWAFAALVLCLIGLVTYMKLQLNFSREGMDRGKRVAVMKKLLREGKVSLATVIKPIKLGRLSMAEQSSGSSYQSLPNAGAGTFDDVDGYLKEILKDVFHMYDTNGDGTLDKKEAFLIFRDFHEAIPAGEFENLFQKFDTSRDGNIDFKEFIALACCLVDHSNELEETGQTSDSRITPVVQNIIGGEDEEDDEIPEDIVNLPPEKQQVAIKKRAFTLLLIGTLLVVLFSDPMVDVMNEIAVRANLPPFYVSFVLAPLASNASEVIASQYYAAKKTTKTITVSLTALEGAAAMNNTFCLSIFMSIIFFRGLAWQYTAETITIVLVQIIIGIMLQTKSASALQATIIGSIFPISILFVALLEYLGLD